MGLNTSLAKEVRKSAFGREMRKPIADGCEYESMDEIGDSAKIAVKDAGNNAEDEIDSAFRSEKYSLESTLVSGKNKLNETLDDGEKQLNSNLYTESILLQKYIEHSIEKIAEELRVSDESVSHLKETLNEDLAAIEEIRQDANGKLDVIDTKCDTRITGVEFTSIPGTKEDYYSMSFIIGGDANG